MTTAIIGSLRWAALVMALAASACGGGAAGGTTSGTGGTTAGGTGGTGGAGGAGDPATCETRSSFSLAVHVVLDASWPDSIGGNAGTGQLHIWNLAKMTAAGTALTGTTQPCGSTLPALTLKPLIGGGKLNLIVPDSAWDAPSAPKAPSAGTLGGWSIGSALSTDTINVLAGLTMADPNGPWPTSHNMVMAVDSDGDGRPGITAVPNMAAGYVMPPVETPILGLGAKADKVDLASRTALALTGTVTSCTQQSGTVTVKFFDNRVVGCHVSGGAECTPTQVDFIDMNSSAYNVTGGTFKSVVLPDAATCADARMALP